MEDNFYEIVWLSATKAVLCGFDNERPEIEQVLTAEQREQVYALGDKHRAEQRALYRSFLA